MILLTRPIVVSVKIGFLLIEIFRRQNYGHQDLFLGGLFLENFAVR
jgi:hypothetical protein